MNKVTGPTASFVQAASRTGIAVDGDVLAHNTRPAHQRRVTAINDTLRGGRSYPTYSMTDTGRVSTTSPNLASMPDSLRAGFVADVGEQFISLSLPRIELLAAAKLSKDSDLLAVLLADDPYAATAAAIFAVDMAGLRQRDDNSWNRLRTLAKITHWSAMTGATPAAIAGTSEYSPEELAGAQTAYDQQFATYANWRTARDNTRRGQLKSAARIQRLAALAFGEGVEAISDMMVGSTRAVAILVSEVIIAAPADVAADVAVLCRERFAKALEARLGKHQLDVIAERRTSLSWETV